MHYQEFQPSPVFTRHVECFWTMEMQPGELNDPFEFLLPDCTFDILFSGQELYLKSINDRRSEKIPAGAAFSGQKTGSFRFGIYRPTRIFGIRFKPFAFANLIETPLCHFNDRVYPLDSVFALNKEAAQSVRSIVSGADCREQVAEAERLLSVLLDKSSSVDQTLRAQLNYILEKKGLVRVSDVFSEFDISKVALHQRFVRKIGLSPKTICRIWRINYFLQLYKKAPLYNLTEKGLEAGYYDQAHSIKEFKSFFGVCPSRFMSKESQLIRVSEQSIARRFSNQYDPR